VHHNGPTPDKDGTLAKLQATWTPDRKLFFWALNGPLEVAVAKELPALHYVAAESSTFALALPNEELKRRRVQGLTVNVCDALPVLVALDRNTKVSDAIRCWSYAAKLALRLGAGQRAVPTTANGHARWRGLFTHSEDRQVLHKLVMALPATARLLPVKDRGPVKLAPADSVLRAFLDTCIDAIYRQGAWPGSARGWVHEFAQALTGDESAFTPREARHQAVPMLLARWAEGADSISLVLGIELGLPKRGQRFPLKLYLHAGHTDNRISIAKAWTAGPHLNLADNKYEHPAHHAVRTLARASRIWAPLRASLVDSSPQDLELDAEQTWSFLSNGAASLRDAGFVVTVPTAFETAGSRRIRARMRILVPTEGDIDLSTMLTFQWEISLGDQVVDGRAFERMVAQRSPIIKYKGQWVLLDPSEVARLPKNMKAKGNLPAAEALRAVLTGAHEGVPVVADKRLDLVIEALKSPPEEPVPSTFVGELRPYQHRGLSWLTTLGRLGLGACLADDMGLGKTVQLIAHILGRKGPHLIVCPTSVLGNWKRELNRFAPGLTVLRYHGANRPTWQLGDFDVVVTTYGLVTRDLEALKQIKWDVFALDEAQSIKNPDSQRAKSARQITARHRVAMSGTPVENRLDELWSLMEFLIPGLLGRRGTFHRKVAVPIERFGDEEMALQLKLGVSPFLLRRLKTDPTVITDLPDKVERKDYVPLTSEQAALYQEVVDDAMQTIAETEGFKRRGQVLAMLTKLKQVCNHPDHYLKGDGPLAGRSGKLERCGHLVEQIVEAEARALIFTQYRQMGVRLQRWLNEQYQIDAPFLHGGSSARAREEMVRRFQEDDDAPPVLLVSLKAGGTGLNLTAATHVIHYDRWWNPAVEDQATDRAYRIGQHRNVQVHKMISQGTLEERIDELLEKKRALADQVVGSGETLVAELDNDALRTLVSLSDDAVMEDG
jgi:superfamily II DNA or RNA helicase